MMFSKGLTASRLIANKGLIAFVLGSALVSSAIVYNGIANRHHEVAAASNPPAEQQPEVPKPHAGTPATDADQANNQDDPNTQQSADGSTDPNAQQNQDQSADQNAANDQNQTGAADGSNDQVAAVASDQGVQEALIRHQQVAAYTARLVRLRKAASLHVLRVVPGAPVTTTSYVAPAVIASPAIFLPTGTQLTVRLTEALGSSISQPDQAFSATLDRDIDFGGKTIIPAGASVQGKVVAARPTGALAGEANLQLEVTSLSVDNQHFHVQTMVRSFGPTIQAKTKFRRFMKGIAKRVEGKETEVLLDEQTAYTFSLAKPLQVQ
jgi:hypothetical protein